MAERKTYTAEDFKGCNGRRVLVEGVIEDADAAFGRYMFVQFDPDDKSSPDLSRCQVLKSAIVEILPEEIKVGDTVALSTSGGSGNTGSVRFIEGGEALVRWDPDFRRLHPLSDLTLVERGQ